jgi:assimilatory nitrate reductase catalytic subunit
VRVARVHLPWHLVAFAECGIERLDAIAALQDGLAFHSAVPLGRERTGILVRAAAAGAPDAEWLEAFDRALGLEGDDMLRYDDPRRGTARRLAVRDNRLVAARLSGPRDSLAGADTLREWIFRDADVAPIRRLLLQNPAAIPSPDKVGNAAPVTRVVCQCFGIDEGGIARAFAACHGDPKSRVEQVKGQLKCGTNCGSCLPDLRRLEQSHAAAGAGKMVA